MCFTEKVRRACAEKDSHVCVGLDFDPGKLPPRMLQEVGLEDGQNRHEPMFLRKMAQLGYDYLWGVVLELAPIVPAFKPNSAFFEALGWRGMEMLEDLVASIKLRFPECLVIVDWKRGDIGNTNLQYVEAFRCSYPNADAMTVQPYFGGDSLESFFAMGDTGIIVMGKTSNKGSGDLQNEVITVRDTRHPHAQPILDEYYLYEGVAKRLVDEWTTDATRGNAGMVAGATHPDDIGRIRKIVGSEVVLLIPGWGSQGGGAELVKYTGMQNGAPTLINASRSVLYAWAKTEGGEEMPYTAAKEAAVKMAEEINEAIKKARKGEG